MSNESSSWYCLSAQKVFSFALLSWPPTPTPLISIADTMAVALLARCQYTHYTLYGNGYRILHNLFHCFLTLSVCVCVKCERGEHDNNKSVAGRTFLFFCLVHSSFWIFIGYARILEMQFSLLWLWHR